MADERKGEEKTKAAEIGTFQTGEHATYPSSTPLYDFKTELLINVHGAGVSNGWLLWANIQNAK